ncbi:hypothetical protein YC2023_079465 [Brassica napus]
MKINTRAVARVGARVSGGSFSRDEWKQGGGGSFSGLTARFSCVRRQRVFESRLGFLRVGEIPVSVHRNQEGSGLCWLMRRGLKSDVIVVKVSAPPRVADGLAFGFVSFVIDVSHSVWLRNGSRESLAVFVSASHRSSHPGTVVLVLFHLRWCPLMAEASTCSIWDAVQSVVWRYIQTSFGGVGKALLLQRRQGNSRHPRQRGELYFPENHVDGRERLPISKDFENKLAECAGFSGRTKLDL